MVIKQLGRAVMNGFDEIAGGLKTNLKVSKILKEGAENTAENAEKVAKEIGEEVSEKVGKRRTATQTERKAKQAYKQTVKEARKDSGDVVDEAINTHTKRQVEGSKKNSEVSYSNKDGKYYRQVGTQKPIELTSDQYKMHLNGQDAELAAQLSESADAWNFGDIANWASENQGLALGIATGVGVAGGALLFGDDD